MNYWVITDTHFGHDMMKREHVCGRPEGFEDMILKGLRERVGPKDILIHLGDVCFYNEAYWHERFTRECGGRRWLVRGNHDKKTLGWYYDHGWDLVVDELKIYIFGKIVALSHKPLPYRDDYDINIHGHVHNKQLHHLENLLHKKNHLVFIEHNYLPINMRKIVE